MSIMNPKDSLRQRIYAILFDIQTSKGRRMEYFWILMAAASVLLVFIESVFSEPLPLMVSKALLYVILEIWFSVIFTLEYLLRLLTTPRDRHYAKSFFGMIDLVTLLPFYLVLFYPAISMEYMTLVRLLRMLRILRIFKMLRYVGSIRLLWDSFYDVRKKLLMFFTVVMILLCLFGSVMYVVEGPEHGFSNLAVSVYWAVVTMTTVGYGDITPHTPLGRVMASLLILIGYSIIAIPTGVLTAHMTEVLQRRHQHRRCLQCQHVSHADDARYCHHCGASLLDDAPVK